MKVDLVTLLVDDIDACKTFYRDVVGLTVKKDRGDYVELEHANVRLALYPRRGLAEMLKDPALGESRQGHTLVLSLPVDSPDDVDATYEELVSRGARSFRPPDNMPWGLRAAFILDPDGNLLEVFAKPE
jgi:catechol 2,3-dioxygenase-like lactoylglutathione lyase family enzyme